VRGLWPRTRQAFTRLWLLPGLIVFAGVFVPWMLAVAARYPHAWDLWNWQYWQRAQGNYEDTRVREMWYYLPIAAGLTIPWAFLLAEGLAAPWMKRYAHWHRGLLYVGLWAALGIAVMSKMDFKKPYYILPAIPGLLLLLGVVADRVYSWTLRTGPVSWTVGTGSWRRRLQISDSLRLAWIVWAVLAVAAAALLMAAAIWSHRELPTAWVRITLIACAAAAVLLLAGAAYIRGRGWLALGMTAATFVVAFEIAWYSCAGAIDAAGETTKIAALARGLDAAGVPAKATLFWVDRRPDARLDFCFNRPSTYLVTPDEIVAQMVDRTHKDDELQALVLKRAAQRLRSTEPVYLILQQRNYNFVGASMPKGVRVVAAAKDGEKRGKGWVVVTNVAQGSAH
jgi:4-amino-4-deoxy-L-arabinose transferase-like glycosyltransferase